MNPRLVMVHDPLSTQALAAVDPGDKHPVEAALCELFEQFHSHTVGWSFNAQQVQMVRHELRSRLNDLLPVFQERRQAESWTIEDWSTEHLISFSVRVIVPAPKDAQELFRELTVHCRMEFV